MSVLYYHQFVLWNLSSTYGICKNVENVSMLKLKEEFFLQL